ncbi:MAG: response regulator [Candidatus Omnitrophica bacterium]|nr:response regulator [Candidatus Omnitrophota bacterium]
MAKKNPKRILIVDDEADFCQLLASALHVRDYHVYTAFNGKMALEIMRDIKPDLLLLDIKMPVMDGNQVMETMVKEKLRIPTVVISAYCDDMSDAFTSELPVKGCLAKPVTLEDIINIVKETIG